MLANRSRSVEVQVAGSALNKPVGLHAGRGGSERTGRRIEEENYPGLTSVAGTVDFLNE
jgi:hypothetical protein